MNKIFRIPPEGMESFRKRFKYIARSQKVGVKYINLFKDGNFNPFTKTTADVKEFYNDIIVIPLGGVA